MIYEIHHISSEYRIKNGIMKTELFLAVSTWLISTTVVTQPGIVLLLRAVLKHILVVVPQILADGHVAK